MANVNKHTREVSANIVYCGPSGSGKTASVEFIHRKLRADLRGRLTRTPTQMDPTVYYESLPVELGEIKGMRTKFQIASAPGDPILRAARKTLLRDVDGIVFVADARADRLDANLESLKDLEENLAAYGRSLADVPLVFQWNREDEHGALGKEEMDRRLNSLGAQGFPTVASDGTGVLEALTTIAKLILRQLRAAPASKAAQPAAVPQTEAPKIRARVAEPPPLDLVEEAPVMEAETLDLSEEISDESELLTELPEGEAVDDDGVALEGEELPEALIEEFTEEMPDLDIPMEPVREDADSDESLELIESGFQPIDFTTEVTELAERGNIEDEWEIVAVGSPTRLGPA
ncbi:MAG: hypothetical protein Q8R92_02985, partial [Deltaproteobacteria bacterium]|nr:hypothetical protein [Deltaproteobacteria bacterium]